MKRNTISDYYDEFLKYDHLIFEDIEWTGVDLQTHLGYEMIFLKHGDITYIADEKIFNVKPGSIILTPPNTPHVINFNKPEQYDRYDLIFDTSIIHPEIFEAIPLGTNVLCAENPEHFLSLFEKLDFYAKHFSGSSLKKIITNVTEEIFYNIAIEIKENSNFAPHNTYIANETLAKAIEYMENNIANQFSLEDMCRDLFISKSYLHKIFSQHLQVSPKKYITIKRLMFAHLEMLSGSKPTEIYGKYGFCDYSSFYRNYRSYYGHSPSELF